MQHDPVDRIFNRMRAKLFNMIEQTELPVDRQSAYKQSIKDITATAWNDVKKLSQPSEESEV